MDSVLWLVVLATGLYVAIRSSDWAVAHLSAFAAATRIPPFVVGITLVSLGTDLPEIANSIVASVSGHGDINIGDSVGSATVQSTLILGIMPLVAGAFTVARDRVLRVGLASVAGLLAGALLMTDGRLSRGDALLLIALWAGGMAVVSRDLPPGVSPLSREHRATHRRHLAPAATGLLLVGAGATTAVAALTELARIWSVPEYFIAFVLASVGTSLPELTVIVSALRKKQWELAVGDAIGATFLDSTLSVAAGPLIVPIAVSTRVVVGGSLTAAVVVGVATTILAVRRRHDRVTAALMIFLFITAYAVVALLELR